MTAVSVLHGRGRPARVHSVFERAFHDRRRGLVGWTIGVVGMVVALLAIYPAIRDNPAVNDYVDSLPEAIRDMVGAVDYTTGTGYLQAEMFSFMLPLLMVLMAVLWASDAIAGEEERGTLDLLLAHPISRGRVVVEQALSLLTGVLVVCAAATVAVLVGAPLVGMDLAISPLLAAMAATATLTVLYGALALTVGAATGHRGQARGVATTLAVAAYLLSVLAPFASWLEPLRGLSPWWHTLGIQPMEAGWQPVRLLVLLALAGGVVAAGSWRFDRRDVAV